MKFFSIARRTCLVLALAASFGAQAQSYPDKPITLLVPFAAGSATDQLARVLGQSITTDTKQAVVTDNKAGASGMLAAQSAARAAPDGYTVLITTNTTHAANEHLYKKLPYDAVKDFAPVTGLGKGSQVLVVRADSPYKNDEAGVKGYDMGYWFAAYVPAKTPPEVVAKLNALLIAGTKSAAAKAFFESSGTEPFPTTPEALARFQQAETQKWGKVIKAAGIEAE